MKRLRVLGWLLLAACLGARADEQALRLVTGDGYAPFTGRHLPGGGLLTVLVQAALAERQLTSTLDWWPWQRGYLMTLRGDYDATFPYVRGAEREAEFYYSQPLITVSQHLFSRAGERFEPERVDELAGRRLCYPLGWRVPAAIQRLLDEGRLRRHAPAGLNECARLLLLGRDDLFIANLALGEAAIRATGQVSRFRRSQGTFGASSLHLIVPRRHPRAEALLRAFDDGLRRLHEQQRYSALIDGYLQQREAQAQP